MDLAIVREVDCVRLTCADVRRRRPSVDVSESSQAAPIIGDMNASLLSPNHLLTGNLDRIAELGTIVTVWAHPDDETYLAGGLMAVARHLGQRVTCVTATDGDFAATEPERRRAATVRGRELDVALSILGVVDRVQFGLRDGECQDVVDRIGVALIAEVLESRRPDTVVTFGPDGLTGHPDHRAVARWTAEAVRTTLPQALLLCPSATPQMVVDDRDINDRFDVYAPGLPAVHREDELLLDLTVSGPWLDVKLAALQAHASQTAGIIDAVGVDRFRRWIAREPLLAFEQF